MDPAKVEADLGLERPKSPHDIQVFLGFSNFYRRFIKNYSKMAAPLINLTRKDVKFKWSHEAEDSFSSLKQAFCSAPILRHFDVSKPGIIEVDASDFAYVGVLSQYGDDGVLHPCAFISKKFNATELNYEIYDKEMLAIVKCMYDHWRHYLEGSGQQVQVFTDHKNLRWFTETKVCNRRQARWAEKLSRFDFTITFRPGTCRVRIGTDRVRDRGYPDADDVGVGARKRPNGSRKIGTCVNRPGPDKHRDF